MIPGTKLWKSAGSSLPALFFLIFFFYIQALKSGDNLSIHIMKKRMVSLFLVLAVLALHLPFLDADPDINISFSRGPFTDEGLNSVQLRNFIEHGSLDMMESDNLLKTPLFNIYLAPFLLALGTSLAAARLAILAGVLAIFFFFSGNKEWRALLFILLPVTMLQYYVFHFNHFALAEMLSISFIVMGIYCFFLYSRDYNTRFLLLAGITVSMAYYAKFQFIYILPLPVLLFFLFGKLDNTRHLTLMILSITGPALLYLLAWFFPFREEFIFVMQGQSAAFSYGPVSLKYFFSNLINFFLVPEMAVFLTAFLAAFTAGIYFVTQKEKGLLFSVVFAASVVWFLLEASKLMMVYLPARYRVGLIFSMGLMISVVLYEWLSKRQDTLAKRSRIVAWFILALLVLENVYDLKNSFSRRTYHLKELNEYMRSADPADGPVLGAWAPSVTWRSGHRSFPVWNHFMNYRDPLKTFKPCAVVSEVDEEDSNQAYREQGIDLHSIADSVHQAKVGRWMLEVIWVNIRSNDK